VMTGFRSFMGISRFQWDLELDCGLAHRDSQDQAEGSWKRRLSLTYRSAFRKRSCVPIRPDQERSSNFVRGQRRQHRLDLLAGSLRGSCREQCPAPAAGSE